MSVRRTGAEPLYCKYVIGVGRGGGSEEGHSPEEAAVEIDLFIIYSFHLAIDRAAFVRSGLCLPLR